MPRRGSAVTAALIAVAAAGALSVAGYSAFTGKSLCSLMACDSAKTTSASAKSDGCCPLTGAKLHAVAASNETKASCDSACTDKAGCDKATCDKTGCDKAGFSTVDASFPLAIPAGFNDGEHVCPSTLTKASCDAEAAKAACSSTCTEWKAEAAALVAAANKGCATSKAKIDAIKAAAESGCSTSKAKYAAIQAAYNAASHCSGNAACDPAACAAKGCDPASCSKSCSGPCERNFTTIDASFPLAIPAGFNDGKQVCPSTLVKARTCTKSAANCPDPNCCKGTGVRADGKPCCGKCTSAKNTAKTAETETTRSEG